MHPFISAPSSSKVYKSSTVFSDYLIWSSLDISDFKWTVAVSKRAVSRWIGAGEGEVSTEESCSSSELNNQVAVELTISKTLFIRAIVCSDSSWRNWTSSFYAEIFFRYPSASATMLGHLEDI
jgi:hypothetical protein